MLFFNMSYLVEFKTSGILGIGGGWEKITFFKTKKQAKKFAEREKKRLGDLKYRIRKKKRPENYLHAEKHGYIGEPGQVL